MFFADGDIWRKMRRKSTPALTTSKIKYIFKNLLRCSEQFKEEIHKMASLKEPLDTKELCALMFTDMICM